MRPPIAITIGNFDGVHRGHLELVRAARQSVGQNGRVIALVFDPHPLTVLRPQDAPQRLSSFGQRCQWLKATGADEVTAIRPTPEFLKQTPREFIAWLAQEFDPDFIVEGADFHFGRQRAGSIQTLREFESEFGYKTVVISAVQAVLADQSIVRASSSLIRWLLSQGRVQDAQALLGRSYELLGDVVPGDKRGRTIGVPTINLMPTDQLLPADGVYSGVAERPDGETFPAAISVGTKPTFGEHPKICEAHLIGYDGPLDDYHWNVRLEFHRWLRDQLKYTSVDVLVDQLHRDLRRVQECAATSPRTFAQSAGAA